jgi:hypothetical protein
MFTQSLRIKGAAFSSFLLTVTGFLTDYLQTAFESCGESESKSTLLSRQLRNQKFGAATHLTACNK